MIIDKDGNEITNPDLSRGYLTEETMTVHHDAVEAVEEVSHYDVVAEFANGGKILLKVIDVPGVTAVPAYDEITVVSRYNEYTADDGTSGEVPSIEDRVSALESAFIDLMMSEESESTGL